MLPVGVERGSGGVSTIRSAWLIEAGPFRLASVRYESQDYSRASSRPALWWLTGCLAISSASVVALLAASPIRDGAMARSVVIQAVPAASAPPTRRLRVSTARRLRAAKTAAAKPASAVAAVAAPEGLPPVGRDAAMQTAWRSGDAQDWAEGGDHGMVVAGPLEPEQGRTCRAFATITRRPDGTNSVEQSRRCE